jgi:YHS domain-containing protein
MTDDGRGGVSIDPVCGKPVLEEGDHSIEYKRRTYYFCSDRCRGRFERQAERIHVGELAKLGALFSEAKAHWGVA